MLPCSSFSLTEIPGFDDFIHVRPDQLLDDLAKNTQLVDRVEYLKEQYVGSMPHGKR